MIVPQPGPRTVSVFGIGVPGWLIRSVFVMYAAALHAGTHVPRLEIPIHPFSWFDKVLHFTAFAGWSALLLASGFFGPALSVRNLRWVLFLGLVIAGLDESTQALRWVNRDASWGDYAVDALGVALAVCGGETIRRRLRAKALLLDVR